MARYNTFKYGTIASGGTGVLYGGASTSVYDASPFTASALGYDKVLVSFTVPGQVPANKEYTRFRVVRNQDYPSETQEDGVIIADIFATYDSASSKYVFPVAGNATLTDGYVVDNNGKLLPLLRQGKYVYYSLWLLKRETSGGIVTVFWDKVADTSTLLAGSHETVLSNTDAGGGVTRTRTTHQKFLDLLPNVYTSSTESPLDIADENSDLSRFLSGFSYTLDEIYTFADLLLPSRDATNFSPELLRTKSFDFGLAPDLQPSAKIQQKLVREAYYMYSRKGTGTALQTFAEAMTGFDSALYTSPNLMLSAQDSTFYKGVGSWQAMGGCTISAVKTVLVPDKTTFSSDISKAIDFIYCAKVVTTVANAQVTNGSSTPITKGIPVAGNSSYTFSAYVQNADSGTLTPTIRWYSITGAFLSSSTTTAWTTSSSWAKKTVTATSPTTAAYATVEFKFTSSGQTYYLDMMQFAAGSAAAFQEARAAEVYLYPTKVNYIPNPSFETNKSLWTITDSGATTPSGDTAPDVISGTKCLSATISTTSVIEAVVSSGSGELTLPSGIYYTYSFYAKAASGTLSATATLKATSNGNTTQNSVDVALTTSWRRYQVNIFVPSTYTSVPEGTYAPTLTATLKAKTGSGVVLFDAAQLEKSYAATDYFDGSMAINGGVWSGSANASAAYMFPNLSTVVSRLAVEMPAFLVTGIPYRVTNALGIILGNSGEVKGFAP